MKLVSIIIVNWNGLKWLKLCLPSLAKQKYNPVEIILVDNASTDDSITWTRKFYPHVVIVKNKENLGFAEANNVGYRKARGKYIMLLNNDTIAKPDFLVELVRKIESASDIAAAQSKLLLMDDHKRLDAVGAYLTPTGFLFHWGFGRQDNPIYDKTQNIYTAKGAAILFRTDVLKMVEMDKGMFDPTYFAYFEETDLCHRIWLSGCRVVYAPKSVIFHKMGGTSTGMDNTFIQFHSFKNRIRTYLKNLGTPALLTIMPVHLLMCEFFSFVSLLRGKLSLSWSIQCAIWWNIVNWSDTMAKRRYIQLHLRCVDDDLFFPLIERFPGFGYYEALSKGKTSDES